MLQSTPGNLSSIRGCAYCQAKSVAGVCSYCAYKTHKGSHENQPIAFESAYACSCPIRLYMTRNSHSGQITQTKHTQKQPEKPAANSQKLQAAPIAAPSPTPVALAQAGNPADAAADAKAEDAKREALNAIFRIEPIGWDARGRRYWNFPWSGGDFAVEIPRLPRTRGTPYHKQGSNRCVRVSW
jgi:hypothetical protein